MTSRRGGTLLRLIPLLLFGISLGAVPEEAVYQWAADVEGVVSKETKAAPRAYLWLPPTTVKAKGLVLAQHNMLEEPIFAHPAFRAELEKADVGLVWITPMVMQTWDKLADAELAAMENVVRELGEKSGHPELGTVPLAPFGHSAMATYPYLFAAARPARTFCAVSIKGDWPEKGRPCWDAALVAAKAKVPMLLISGEYEDGYNRWEKARDLMKEDPEAHSRCGSMSAADTSTGPTNSDNGWASGLRRWREDATNCLGDATSRRVNKENIFLLTRRDAASPSVPNQTASGIRAQSSRSWSATTRPCRAGGARSRYSVTNTRARSLSRIRRRICRLCSGRRR